MKQYYNISFIMCIYIKIQYIKPRRTHEIFVFKTFVVFNQVNISQSYDYCSMKKKKKIKKKK